MIQLKSKDVKPLRDKLLQDQDGKCPICTNKIDGDACLDHQHKKRIKGTGLVRQVLCRACNIFLGKIENNCVRFGITQKQLPSLLRNISDYLERPHTEFIHPSEKPKEKILSKRDFNKMSKLYKDKFPRRKQLQYPKSKKLTKTIQKCYSSVGMVPKFNK